VPVLQFCDRERCYHRRHRFPHDITRRGAGRDRIIGRARGTRPEDNAARRSCLMVDLVKSCVLNAMRRRRRLRSCSHRRDGFTVD
jgi:hypothetical protein